jgi:mRNA-degrading endonuclease toxin of MazEF toxin-antitoxin module
MTQAGDVPEVVTKLKLRRVLLLQSGSNPGRQDVMVARISLVTDGMRGRRGFYERFCVGRHPTMLRLADERHGLHGQEAYVNLLNVSPIAKNAVLRRVGSLTEHEMREVTDRLITSLELDISRRLEGQTESDQ